MIVKYLLVKFHKKKKGREKERTQLTSRNLYLSRQLLSISFQICLLWKKEKEIERIINEKQNINYERINARIGNLCRHWKAV